MRYLDIIFSSISECYLNRLITSNRVLKLGVTSVFFKFITLSILLFFIIGCSTLNNINRIATVKVTENGNNMTEFVLYNKAGIVEVEQYANSYIFLENIYDEYHIKYSCNFNNESKDMMKSYIIRKSFNEKSLYNTLFPIGFFIDWYSGNIFSFPHQIVLICPKSF